VAFRDRSEIAELHGADGELEAVTLRSGERLASIAERDDIEVGLNRRVATRPAASPAS
jgi:hypothetical protein